MRYIAHLFLFIHFLCPVEIGLFRAQILLAFLAFMNANCLLFSPTNLREENLSTHLARHSLAVAHGRPLFQQFPFLFFPSNFLLLPRLKISPTEILEYAVKIGIDPENETNLIYLARQGLLHPLPENWKPW